MTSINDLKAQENTFDKQWELDGEETDIIDFLYANKETLIKSDLKDIANAKPGTEIHFPIGGGSSVLKRIK